MARVSRPISLLSSRALDRRTRPTALPRIALRFPRGPDKQRRALAKRAQPAHRALRVGELRAREVPAARAMSEGIVEAVGRRRRREALIEQGTEQGIAWTRASSRRTPHRPRPAEVLLGILEHRAADDQSRSPRVQRIRLHNGNPADSIQALAPSK